MNQSIQEYNNAQSTGDKEICNHLSKVINHNLPEAECKVWHAHPIWFLDGNLIVGYNKLKGCIRLMFWSGADFDEQKLMPGTGKFKDASIRYTDVLQIEDVELQRWLGKARNIQWDYKNVIKRKGKLERLK